MTQAQLFARAAWLGRLAQHAEGERRAVLSARAALAAYYAFRFPGTTLFGRPLSPSRPMWGHR